MENKVGNPRGRHRTEYVYKFDEVGNVLERRCCICLEFKIPENFSICRTSSRGLTSLCKECRSLQLRKQGKGNDYRPFKIEKGDFITKYTSHEKNNVSSTISALRKQGVVIGKTEYFKLYEESNKCCYLCGDSEIKLRKKLSLDHCHKSKKYENFYALSAIQD